MRLISFTACDLIRRMRLLIDSAAILIAAILIAVPTFGQTAKPVASAAKHDAPAPAPPQKPSELQTAHIDLAIKDFQLAQMRADQAQQAAVNARGAALQMIAAVKAELKLDETWDYDDQREVFVKKPAPVEPAKPASK